jgi:tagaturonate reductase
MQYSSKMKMRTIPVLLEHYRQHPSGPPPQRFSLGFAAYLLFMKGVKKEHDKYWGQSRGEPYPINDDKAAIYYELWQKHTANEVVNIVLKDHDLWGADLSLLKGLAESVLEKLNALIKDGAAAALTDLILIHKKNSL